MKKRFYSLLTAAVLLLSVCISACAVTGNTGFSDVSSDAWYAEAVDYVNENGLMSGTDAGSFSPEQPTSRAMLVTVLYREAGSPQVNTTAAFPDVSADNRYSDAVNWAAENSVVSGYDDGNFGPDDPVSREQIATILWRYTGSPAATAQEFDDEASISDYASVAVDWARSTGVMNGVGGNRFDPQGIVTRAQTAQTLMNYLTRQNITKPLAQIEGGTIRGFANDGIYGFLGVPYAQAEERFVPASPVTPWEGEFDASEYGMISLQGNTQSEGTDNNAQNLNIWTPGLHDGAKRPVMVWLHGGGFSNGSANETQTNGANLSRSGDVVVVSVNHRLGLAGYLDLSAYGDKYKYSGNVGMMDIIDSLKWIQRNIEEFGGDPDNVTVFGESGGGAKVLALMSSPYAEGLFHKGIVESGATEGMGVSFNTLESSRRLTEVILSKLNVTESTIESLQTIPYERLAQAATEALSEVGEELQIPASLGAGYGMDWEPVVDGDFLPTNPVTADGFAAPGKDIPLLIGTNLNEWTPMFSGAFTQDLNALSAQEIYLRLEQQFGDQADAIVEAFLAAYPQKSRLDALYSETMLRLPILKITLHKADQGGAPVYSYVFTYGSPMAYHTSEIPYVFNNLALTGVPAENTEAYDMAERMSAIWIAFAKTGSPQIDGIPDWPAYTRESGAAMLLDINPTVGYHHDREFLSLQAPDYMAELMGEFADGEEPAADGKILVAYYSATNNTKAVAETIAETLGADIFAITPAQPYTSADLNWTDSSSRVVREHNDPEGRHVELITTTVPDFDSYDTVFIGYPIWWGGAAWVLDDFVTENDFTGKTVIPFCTSSSSPLGSSGTDLAALAGTGNWLEGRRFSSGVSANTVREWLTSLER